MTLLPALLLASLGSCAPETWFHVIGGNASKAGIVADLDAIKEAGISGIQFFHGHSDGELWPGVAKGTPCLSADWEELVRFTSEECHRRGLTFKMQNCPGWSMSGGPWITPDKAMRKLVAYEPGQKPAFVKDDDYHEIGTVTFAAADDSRDAELVRVFPNPQQLNHHWAYEPKTNLNGRVCPPGAWQDSAPMTFAESGASKLDMWEAKAGWGLRKFTMATNAAPVKTIGTKTLVFGHVNAKRTNHPAPPEGTGWECDKMDPRGFEANFAGYLGKLLKAGVKIDGTLVDSWECGVQTWTWKMEEEFEKRNGYRLRPWLPALFGHVLTSEAETEKFLLDWRNTCSRLIEENYFGTIARLAHENGMTAQYETAFGDVIVGDILRYWKYADEPMCEFWSPHDDAKGFVGSHDFKPVLPCVSAAHVYGKRRVSAEALTSFELTFDENFKEWKKIVDRHFGRGVTHIVFHTYTHNPVVNGKPPSTSFGGAIGSPFLRKQTWWPYLKEFTKYLAFCGRELERGQPVVDILMYLGDDVNHKPSENPLLFENRYKYDYCNADALRSVIVADGRLAIKQSNNPTNQTISYRVLWVPKDTFLKPATEARMAELAKQGARVIRGDFTPDWPSPLKSMTGCDGKDTHWYQRRDGDEDVFFIAQPNGISSFTYFRNGKFVKTVNPVTGKEMTADTPVLPPPSAAAKDGEIMLVAADKKPDEPWATHRKYSYMFTVPEKKAKLRLSLGDVRDWATVWVNGKEAARLWCEPYACDIAPFVKEGKNEIRIETVSTWYNTLVHEAALPEGARTTWTKNGPKPGAKMTPAGLLGPVVLDIASDRQGAVRTVEITPDWGGNPRPLGWRSRTRIKVLEADGRLATNGLCHVKIDNDGPETVLEETRDLAKENPFTVIATRFTPGFLRVNADGAVRGIPFEPGRIAPAVPKPADFGSFWADALAKAKREVPLDVKLEKWDAKCTADYDYYRLSVATTNGRRVYGFLSVPTGAKTGAKYPLEFEMPGAGCGIWANEMTGSKDTVRLFFSVFPFEPCGDAAKLGEVQARYEALDREAEARWGVKRYCQAGISGSREDYFYYPVILGAVRGLDWVCGRPYVDAGDVRCNGTSQGGGMGLALTALSGRITRATIFVPALTGLLDYKANRRSGWPQLVESQKDDAAKAAAERNAPYFDGVNFASMITCPIRFAVGFDDPTCAPHAVYAAYNVCPAKDKEILEGVGMNHGVFGAFYDELGRWRATGEYPSRRPPPEKRTFRSKAVDAKIAEIVPKLKNRKLAWLFGNCFPNTLDTTAHYRRDAKGDDETFVYTGDIHAMWLRDSAAQVWPYLGLVKEDEALRRLIRGLIRKQLELIRLDRYANAFNDVPAAEAETLDHVRDDVLLKKVVYERKYELDSLCYPIRLAYGYWKATGDASVFDADFRATARIILDTMKEQQRKDGYRTPYYFLRHAPRNNSIDNSGFGRQTKPVGLIVSAFRPSDDATILPFLVPSNHMAVDVLGKAAEIARAVLEDAAFAKECVALRDEVAAALKANALLINPATGRRQWAFEVDGFGSALFMDDANVPSLIALPYFTDIPKDDPDYLATRDFVWSKANPFFFEGTAITGIGGPHCEPNTVWPMSVILRALTATDDGEIRTCLETIVRSDAGTGFIHESVSKDDAQSYSRSWFAWANTLFGELVYRLYEDGRIDLLNSVK